MVVMGCADCGCIVERGVIVTPCEMYPECCCRDLPQGAMPAPE